MATVIVTDSSAHIPVDLLKEHGIEVVPFHIHFEGEDFLEGEKYTHPEFYRKLQHSRNFPTTSQPAVGSLSRCLLLNRLPGTISWGYSYPRPCREPCSRPGRLPNM